MSKQPSPAPTASAVGPCPTVIQIVGRPGTGRVYPAPSHHPTTPLQFMIKSFLGLYFLLGPVCPGAPVAQWVKRWPTDLAVQVGSPLEAKSAQL